MKTKPTPDPVLAMRLLSEGLHPREVAARTGVSLARVRRLQALRNKPEPVWNEPLFIAVNGFRTVFGNRHAQVRYLTGRYGEIVGVEASDGHQQIYRAWVRGRMPPT